GGGEAVGEHVAGDAVIGEWGGGGGSAVVYLVAGICADGQRLRDDICRRRGGCILEQIIGSVGARNRDSAHADCLARAHVLVCESCSRIDAGHAVVANLIVG